MWELIKFVWKNRKEFPKLKKEAWDVGVKVMDALNDNRVTKEEVVGILKETGEFLDSLIISLED